MAGQSINDRILAARLSIAGQGLAKSVCKATTEEVIGPKKKHLDYLLHCTNEPNVSIPQLANLLIERTNNASWVVVFKALVTVHHLMCYGNERFTQYLASSNCNFQLSSFLDKTGIQVGYDMSTFIRRYAKYLNEKALSYRIAAFDFCKVKRGSKEDGILRTMNAEKLVKTLPVLQNQIDALLEFDCTANELTNGVINTAFMLLFRDLIRLFACYNDGIINLLEKYFDMNKKMARDALDIYKKFLIRMDRVAEFLKVAENVGIDKGDIPDLTKAPSSLLDALEQHLATLEGKKGGATTPTQPTSGRQTSVKNAVLALSNTSSAFGTAAASSVGPRQTVNGGGNEDDPLRKLALEEEEAILELHRERRLKELAGQSPSSERNAFSGTNPFLSSPTANADSGGDLFGSPVGGGGGAGHGHPSKTSDDLLCLAGNPFSDDPTSAAGGGAGTAPPPFWSDQNGLSSGSAFASESSFAAVFGGNSNARPVVASNHGITIGELGSDKANCDLTIAGLNPFANIVTTPSPSAGPYEFGGQGTTPILGGSESAAHVSFAAAFGGDHSSEQHHDARGGGGGGGGGSRSASPCPVQFESPFDHHHHQQQQQQQHHHLTPSKVPPPRPPSPAPPGTMAPKPTPVSSPAPLSFMTRSDQSSSSSNAADVFGDFPFGGGGSQAAAPSAAAPSPPPPDPQPFPASPALSACTKPPPASAFDDLNASVKAVFGEVKGPFIPTTQLHSPSASASSAAIPPPSGPLPGFQSPGRQQAFGFGSPSKMVPEFDAFGDILQPVQSSGVQPGSVSSSSGPTSKQGASKVITGDLDSSLASLVQNLEINRASGGLTKSGHVWNSPRNTAKTGGANWIPSMAPGAGTGGGGGGGGPGTGGSGGGSALWNSPQHGAAYQPMGGGAGSGPGATTTGRPADWSSGLMGGHFPPAPVQPFTGGAPPGGVVQGPPAMMSKGFPTRSPQQTTLDPFGAL